MSEDEYTQPQQEPQEQTTQVPYNELEMYFMTTQPAWGREVTNELNAKLIEIKGEAYENAAGELVVDVSHLWGLLSYYTRDLRLGNLNPYFGEVEYCRYWLDFAGDCLRSGYVKSFLTALSRVISLLELSQSKQGFFRKRMGTVTSEKLTGEMEPAKKKILGGKRNE